MTPKPPGRLDRCDRCAAAAQVRVSRYRRVVLDFCAHHFHRHADALLFSGWVVIVDNRESLRVTPKDAG